MARYLFKVRGVLTFPLQMLYRDKCWPYDEAATDAIHATIRRDNGSNFVAIQLMSLYPPTAEEWSSYGYEVIEHRQLNEGTMR